MKKLLFVLAVFLIASGFGGTRDSANAQPPYVTADFTGTWGFGVVGTIILTPPIPPTPPCSGWLPISPALAIAIDGTLTGDGKGGLTGTQTFNANGLICSGTLVGRYTLNSDGTGTLNNVVFTAKPGSPPQCATTPGNSSFTFSNGVAHIDLTGIDCFEVTSGTATKQ